MGRIGGYVRFIPTFDLTTCAKHTSMHIYISTSIFTLNQRCVYVDILKRFFYIKVFFSVPLLNPSSLSKEFER